MHSALFIIESLDSSSHVEFGYLLIAIDKALQQYKGVERILTNVYLIPAHAFLQASSDIDTQCKIYSAHPGQNFRYRCLVFSEEPQWIYSK